MFKEEYKKAYDGLKPPEDYLQRIEEKAGAGSKKPTFYYVIKPIAASFAVLCILSVLVVPVLAKESEGIYRIIERYVPRLADYIIPEKHSDSSCGIEMQLEAATVKNNTAEIIISFTDEEGYDYINGKVDMYSNYGMRSYGGDSSIGGCSFLEYNEEEDKAYFKMDVTTFDTFSKDKLTVYVGQLLTNCTSEEKEISMAEIERNPVFKNVTVSGRGGKERERVSQYFGTSIDEYGTFRLGAQVLDLGEMDSAWINTLTVTQIAYADGLLRIQTCRGCLDQADRHLQPFLVEENGNERINDLSVGWHEEIDGVKVLFNEHWFLVEEKELENLKLNGVYYISDESVKGDWEITFRIETD